MLKLFFRTPQREYFFLFLTLIILLFSFFAQGPYFDFVIFFIALMGILIIFARALSVLLRWDFSIDVLYFFALLSLFIEKEFFSVVFVIMILSLGRLYDFYISYTRKTIQNFSDKIPKTVLRQNRNVFEEVSVDKVKSGDILLIKEKEFIPVDGIVVFGEAQVKETSVTGISALTKKILNDKVFSGSFVSSGSVKIRAICKSEESVFVKKAKIIKESEEKASYLQCFSRKINEYFLPFVFIFGIVIYLVTDNILMFSAVFLVVCHRILTVFVPLQYKKVFDIVVRHGVILKNGKKFEMLGKSKVVILDKNEVLTFCSFQIENVYIEEGISKIDFWKSVAIAEKYSEDSLNKALFREAVNQVQIAPDAQKYQVYNGSGVYAQYGRDNIIVGNRKLLLDAKVKFPRGFQKKLSEENESIKVLVAINNIFVGMIVVVNSPEEKIRESVEKLRKIGVEKIVLFTSDNEKISQNVVKIFGVDDFFSSSSFEEKKVEIEKLSKKGFVSVLGDGKYDYSMTKVVNIVMGKDCSAVLTSISDIVFFNDDLRLLPKLILLSRELTRTIYRDIIIWFLINFLGILLVLVGFINPVLAILYSFTAELVYLILLQGKMR